MKNLKTVAAILILATITACSTKSTGVSSPDASHDIESSTPVPATPTVAPPSATPSPTSSPTIAPTDTPAILPVAGIITINAFSNKNSTIDVYMMHSDGSDLTHHFTVPEGGGVPAWSPDGEHLTYPRAAISTSYYEEEILILDADMNNVASVVSADAIFADISWSPDGERLAFHYNLLDTGEPMGIFTIGVDGSNLMRISEGQDRCPAWSPDGEQIVFRRDVRFIQEKNDFFSHLFIANSNGDRNEYQLTDESLGDAGCPAWSPDGKLIAFYIVIDERKSAIYTIRPDGSDLRQLTDASDKNSRPTWSPDGSQIAFVSDRDGYDAIFIMNVDGSGAMRITYPISGLGIYTLGRLSWLADEQ